MILYLDENMLINLAEGFQLLQYPVGLKTGKLIEAKYIWQTGLLQALLPDSPALQAYFSCNQEILVEFCCYPISNTGFKPVISP